MAFEGRKLREAINSNRWLHVLDGIVGGIVTHLPMVLFSAVTYAARRLFDAVIFGSVLYIVFMAVCPSLNCKEKLETQTSQMSRASAVAGPVGRPGSLLTAGVEKVPGGPK